MSPIMSDPARGRNIPLGSALSAAAFSPLYQQIKALLVQALDAGEWKPG
jgi:GntR family transcriptional regulator